MAARARATILMLLVAAGAAPAGARPPGAPAVASAPAGGSAPAAPSPDVLVAQIRAALVESSDQRLDVLLRALRRVRDPGLRPLFAQLAASHRPILRVHGILGLAELESPARIDMLLVKRLPDPREQLVVLGEALRAGMLPPEQLGDVARWPGLDPTLVVLVLGRLERAGVAVEPAAFDVFMAAPDPAPEGGTDPMPALLATLERRQQAAARPGVPEADSGALDELLAAPATPERDRMAVILLDYIRQERLTASAPVALRLLEGRAQGAVAFECLRALLAVAPHEAATWDAFRSWYEGGDLAQRVRLGLVLLDAVMDRPLLPPGVAGPPAPALPEEYAALLAGDAHMLVAKMGGAAGAVLRGCGPESAGPLADLVAEAHGPTVAWAMRLARQCGGETGGAIALAVLRAAEAAGAASRPGEGGIADAAVAAAALLADTDPAALSAELARAAGAGNGAMERLILMGALRSTNPAVAGIARAPGGPDGAGTPLALSDPTAAAMATLLGARHRAELTEADYAVLAGIAQAQVPAPPADSLGEPLRLQAAWLALRCRGHQRVALARILADDPK